MRSISATTVTAVPAVPAHVGHEIRRAIGRFSDVEQALTASFPQMVDTAGLIMLRMLFEGWLADKPPCVKELRLACRCPTTSILRRIDMLEMSGLAARSVHPVDHRRSLVRLTDAGLKRMVALAELLLSFDSGAPHSVAPFVTASCRDDAQLTLEYAQEAAA